MIQGVPASPSGRPLYSAAAFVKLRPLRGAVSAPHAPGIGHPTQNKSGHNTSTHSAVLLHFQVLLLPIDTVRQEMNQQNTI
ncbi:MAG: hypothetical protein RR356_00235 [Bacteroidales bacterium]